MGEAIAEQVLAAGFALMVHDLRPEPLERLRVRGAIVASSPAALGAHAQLLEVSIAGDAAVEDALFGPEGIVAAMAPGSIVALHGTMHPANVHRLAERAAAAGIGVIDAPVSGGQRAAAARTLCYMLGGDAALVERCRPVFVASGGDRIFHLGPLGAGAAAKIAQQMLTCIHIVGTAESVRMATAAEIDIPAFLKVLAVTSAQSRVADDWLGEMARIGPQLTESFYLSLTPAVELARDLGLPLPVTTLAQQLVRDAFGSPRPSRIS